MGRNSSTSILLVSFLLLSFFSKAQDGESIFKTSCAACHTIGGGRLVGPDLNGIATLRSEAWLIEWIKSSQAMVHGGDADAIAIFNEYNKIPMPDQNFSDAEIKGVIEYIQSKSTAGGAPAAATTATAATTEPQEPIKSSDDASEQEILLGQHLFEGDIRLANGGLSCVSCHNLETDRIIPGGSLAKDLTTVFSRMGGDAGITAILNAPPFPAMTEAYKNKSMNKDEIFAITSFLNTVEKESATQAVTAVSPFLKYGFIAFLIWVGVVFLVWSHRKKYAVNKRIYDRQVKSY